MNEREQNHYLEDILKANGFTLEKIVETDEKVTFQLLNQRTKESEKVRFNKKTNRINFLNLRTELNARDRFHLAVEMFRFLQVDETKTKPQLENMKENMELSEKRKEYEDSQKVKFSRIKFVDDRKDEIQLRFYVKVKEWFNGEIIEDMFLIFADFYKDKDGKLTGEFETYCAKSFMGEFASHLQKEADYMAKGLITLLVNDETVNWDKWKKPNT